MVLRLGIHDVVGGRMGWVGWMVHSSDDDASISSLPLHPASAAVHGQSNQIMVLTVARWGMTTVVVLRLDSGNVVGCRMGWCGWVVHFSGGDASISSLPLPPASAAVRG